MAAQTLGTGFGRAAAASPRVCLLLVHLVAGCQGTAPWESADCLSAVAGGESCGAAQRGPATSSYWTELLPQQDQTPPRTPPARGDGVVLTSAVSASGADAGPPAPDAAAKGQPSRAALLPAPAPASPCSPAAAGSGPATFTLFQAINQSLLTNPDLVTLRGRLNVNQAMVGVARTYPWNPFVQAQFFPRGQPFVAPEPGVPASGAGQSNYYIWAMQRFELAHQRQFRVQGALASLDQV
jgi:hypothetical protein